jgi:hypothetical protein
MELRPAINSKGDLLLVPDSILDENLSSNSVPDIPPKPKLSNLSTPSTMSPLFPSLSKSDSLKEPYSSRSPKSSDLSHKSQQYKAIKSIHTKYTDNNPI